MELKYITMSIILLVGLLCGAGFTGTASASTTIPAATASTLAPAPASVYSTPPVQAI